MKIERIARSMISGRKAIQLLGKRAGGNMKNVLMLKLL